MLQTSALSQHDFNLYKCLTSYFARKVKQHWQMVRFNIVFSHNRSLFCDYFKFRIIPASKERTIKNIISVVTQLVPGVPPLILWPEYSIFLHCKFLYCKSQHPVHLKFSKKYPIPLYFCPNIAYPDKPL